MQKREVKREDSTHYSAVPVQRVRLVDLLSVLYGCTRLQRYWRSGSALSAHARSSSARPRPPPVQKAVALLRRADRLPPRTSALPARAGSDFADSVL